MFLFPAINDTGGPRRSASASGWSSGSSSAECTGARERRGRAEYGRNAMDGNGTIAPGSDANVTASTPYPRARRAARALGSWPRWTRSTGARRGTAASRCLQDLLRIPTVNRGTNEPGDGNERPAAERIAEHLRAAASSRASSRRRRARRTSSRRSARGNGERAPLLLNAHLDVVEADASRWTPPAVRAARSTTASSGAAARST